MDVEKETKIVKAKGKKSSGRRKRKQGRKSQRINKSKAEPK